MILYDGAMNYCYRFLKQYVSLDESYLYDLVALSKKYS